ncbi:MAG: AAA family ATPase [Candidatus Omnitrophota bacterium]
MYLKKLELVGFKSFLNKTTLHFEPGVTAVVGPNGCGKSNIFDSIRWVLGEQSVKALRGSDMQDVIFNGTDVKEPLSMAEVTLTFDNSQRFFPTVDNTEVAVTRRIFRSGESEYLLNKSLVRLKDILDILMGTGIGSESYSLVAQGQIDLILSSRPDDRRMVFDEAAGITKYKSQKKEAARRLEETEQNLLRVNDIVTEVKRQIGSLERQANKARKYKEAFEHLKNKEVIRASLQKEFILRSKDEIIKELAQMERQEVELVEVIREEESKITNCQQEVKSLGESIVFLKNDILNLDNQVARSSDHINFNEERIKELDEDCSGLNAQAKEAKEKLNQGQGKLSSFKDAYANLTNTIEAKSVLLEEKEQILQVIGNAIKLSLELIAQAKKDILQKTSAIANTNNEITDLGAQQQVHLSRKKRLELERAKVKEERKTQEDNLAVVMKELRSLEAEIADLNAKYSAMKSESDKQTRALSAINSDLEKLERESLTLHSHKEFIEKLKIKYDDISEAMNAVILLDKIPLGSISGLVVKIKEQLPSEKQGFKVSGEAKPIDLDTQKISDKIQKVQQEIYYLENARETKDAQLQDLKVALLGLEEDLRQRNFTLTNKKALQATIQEQLNRVLEEEELIALEISDLEREFSSAETSIAQLMHQKEAQETALREKEELIAINQAGITKNNSFKEDALVFIAQTKAEIDGLNRRVNTDAETLRILEEACEQGRLNISNIEKEIHEGRQKTSLLLAQVKELELKVTQVRLDKEAQINALKALEDNYRLIVSGSGEAIKKIDDDRKKLDNLKDRLYKLQMQNKDTDFKLLSLKERLLQSYKVDLEVLEPPQDGVDENLIGQEIEELKKIVDSYGTVNLVAIEEYDELKKRYDFLMQQQTDLATAKDSLHEAILKINRTTRKMFMDTFEQVRGEFRNYFRLLFNGGDAQVFLIDEQDPLESGIEIICRPPGKKLQNVLLLSGGEKALSAIALIFAIFKVKPSPFCILDEIDAALDEANVDRYGRLLQEFIKNSQFIVITHNKRTIVNADVMYGITMEESGVSKIVSVKFSKDKPKDEEPQAATLAQLV